MSKIKIENFGPIKKGLQTNNGWIEFDRVTIFIGNQGSGKSTVAKLFSTLSWLEKSINRGDTNKGNLSFAKFIEFTKYQKIHNYFQDDTYINYIGEKFQIIYDRSEEFPIIKEIEKGKYIVPKIMYIPAERNFLSTISDAYNVKGLPDNLFTFAEELKKAQKALKGKEVDLQIGSYRYEYDEGQDNSYVIGEDYKINLLEASSGLQSFTPLFLVSRELSTSISEEENTLRKNMSVSQSIRMDNEIAELMLNKSIQESEKTDRINEIRSRYYNRCFINIVEEPEQNLFPSSQWKMLQSLLKLNNINKSNKLILTTHSPYIINFMSIAIQGNYLYEALNKSSKASSLTSKLDKIVSINSLISSDKVVIYQLDEINGNIDRLETFEGIPSDKNYLNNKLREGNSKFDELLEIEEEL